MNINLLLTIPFAISNLSTINHDFNFKNSARYIISTESDIDFSIFNNGNLLIESEKEKDFYKLNIHYNLEIELNNVINKIKDCFDINYIEKDKIGVIGLDSTVYNSNQKYLSANNINKVWSLTKGDNRVKVGVIDTGIDSDHINLSSNISSKFNAVNSKDSIEDKDGHGTHVAGIIASNGNNSNVYGIAPNISIVPIKAYDDTNSDSTEWCFYASDVASAINYCEENDIRIINFSGWKFHYSKVMKNAIKNYSGLFITISGNENRDLDTFNNAYPAKYHLDNMIVVGNCYNDGNISSSSAFSENYVDLFATGENIYSTYLNNSFKSLSGSSMAAPVVSGIAALIMSLNKNISVCKIKELILSKVNKNSKLKDYCVTSGYLNAFDSVHFDHVYTSSYSYIDTSYHYSYCVCGEKIRMGHVLSGGNLSSNLRYGTCIYCGGKAEYGFVAPSNIKESSFEKINNLYYPKNTTYINEIEDLSYEDTKKI